MSDMGLPTTAEALASLRDTGNQFTTVPLALQPLGDMTYQHRLGRRRVEYDRRVIRSTAALYTDQPRLRLHLDRVGGRVRPMHGIVGLVERAVRAQEALVWGVSGYASIGHSCAYEAGILQRVYKTFDEEQYRPALVADGAAGAGVLGISGVLAARSEIPTLGVTPLQGISSMAPRKHMVVYGHTYRDREVVVATVPDILLVVGGGGLDAQGRPQGTLREALMAEAAGGIIVLTGQRSVDPHSMAQAWQMQPSLVRAKQEGRLFHVLKPGLTEIKAAVRAATTAAAKRFDVGGRQARMDKLRAMLCS